MATLDDVFTKSALKSPRDAMGFWMFRLTLAYQRRAEAILKSLGLTHLQFMILSLTAWLNHAGARTSQRDLVEVSGVLEAQVSLMVKALKAKNLVQQRTGDDNVHVRLVVVTPEGVDLLAKAIPRMSALQEELWPPGEPTDRLLGSLEETLARWEAKR